MIRMENYGIIAVTKTTNSILTDYLQEQHNLSSVSYIIHVEICFVCLLFECLPPLLIVRFLVFLGRNLCVN